MIQFKGFITNLGKYNESELIGKWIDFPIDEDDLEKVLEEIGINEEYEEYFFTDFEDNIFGFGMYESIDNINYIIEEFEYLCNKYNYIDEIDEIIEILLNEYNDNIFDLDNILDKIYFFNGCNTMLDCAYREIDDLYSYEFRNNSLLGKYFNYEEYASDMEDSGCWFEYSDGMFVIYY